MRLAETVGLAAIGALLGGLTLWLLDLWVLGAAIGGANGVLAGAVGTYNWRARTGWFALLLDSTWGLVGTALGLLTHAINLVWPAGRLDPTLSRRSNMFVYVGGFRARRGFVVSQGNVVSNAGPFTGPARERRLLIVLRHEAMHVWQSRLFGPFFQLLYATWVGGGSVVGSLLALRPNRRWFPTVETLAYYDNPFEFFAYRRDEHWPPSQAAGPLWRSRPKRALAGVEPDSDAASSVD